MLHQQPGVINQRQLSSSCGTITVSEDDATGPGDPTDPSDPTGPSIPDGDIFGIPISVVGIGGALGLLLLLLALR